MREEWPPRLVAAAALGFLAFAVILESAWGPGQAPTYRTPLPARRAATIPENLFGMHIVNGNWPSAPFGALRTSGVGWPQLEPLKGAFQWTRLDQQVNSA